MIMPIPSSLGWSVSDCWAAAGAASAKASAHPEAAIKRFFMAFSLRLPLYA
jgi:hypothetical protein